MVLAARSRQPASALRTLVALACLLSFALLNFVGQTHIHPLLSRSVVAASHAASPAPGSKGGKSSQDDLTCPYCQAAALVGLVMGPSGLLLFLPGVSPVVAAVPEQLRPAPEPPTYVWRSRGPPHA
jgi:hypothetical protein